MKTCAWCNQWCYTRGWQ